MRNIYSSKSIFTSITQGSIINNCVANEYENFDVFGLIITPRCDMAHGIKVPTVHFLPIVRLEDWIKVDFIAILEVRLRKELEGKINQWIKENRGTADFLKSALATKENVKELLKDSKHQEIIQRAIQQYYNEDEAFSVAMANAKKQKRQILKELQSGELRNFYLIEHWDTDERCKHLVIILREVHQISRDVVREFLKGFIAEEFDRETLRYNSLKSDKSEYKLKAEISSPFIEHILQSFVYNFSRIGVEDLEQPNWDELI